jgi:hypothetical protein
MDTDIDVPPAGYIFGAEALSVVADTVTKLLQHDPQIVYLLDRKQLHSPHSTPADAKLLPLPTSCHWRRRSPVRFPRRHPCLPFFTPKGIYHNAQLV